MKLKIKNKTLAKHANRIKKKQRVRKKIFGTADRPRLCVFRSLKYITAQVVDDTKGATVLSLSSKKINSSNNVESAKAFGAEFGKKLKEKNIEQLVFDRNGFLYHGRIKAFADAVRESGLKF